MTDPRALPTAATAEVHYNYTVLPGLFMQSESSTDDSTFDFVHLTPLSSYPSNLVENRALRPHTTHIPHRRCGLKRLAVDTFRKVYRALASRGSEYQGLVPGKTWAGRT
jgi:hypothetical protein